MPIPEQARPRVEVLGQLDPAQVGAVSGLIERATEADGVRPLSEHVMLHLRYGGDEPVRNVLVHDAVLGGSLAGVVSAYGHLDVTDEVAGASAEIVVDPDHRRRGLGRLIVAAMLAATPDGRLRLWAHGEHPAAAALASSLGLRRSRSLWQMRRSLYAALPAPSVPPGVTIRTFEAGRDDQGWVTLNATAFADHPEQGSWDIDDLHRRMREPWFDPRGFFLAEREGRLVGFHWTKVHGADGHDGQIDPLHHHHGHPPIGEVYVVGVDPAEHGNGLGKALTLTGLRHLRARGLPDAMLYVDSDNTAAIGLYSALGFTHWETDVMFSTDSTSRTP